MSTPLRESDLEAYLDEALPPDQMARVELALRDAPELLDRVAAVHSRRNAGVHSLGEIWRGGRLSCASREQLGSYLLGVLPDEESDYIRFHLEVVGCRYCLANLADLQNRQAEQQTAVETRRRRYFETSAGYLRGKE